MVTSSILMLAAGLGGLFGPAEILPAIGSPATPALGLLLQLFGALCFGMGLINWIAKDNAIGGIYSRPLSAGNSAHFGVGSLVLLRPAFHQPGVAVMVALVIYAFFATAFGTLLFSQGPVGTTTPKR